MKTFLSRMIALAAVVGAAHVAAATPAENSTPNPVDLQEYLRAFHANPKKVMYAPLAKLDENGKVITRVESPFGENLTREEILKARNEVRGEICKAAGKNCDRNPSHFAAPNERNQVRQFLEGPYISKLHEMERLGLMEFILPSAPWTDSFWPMRKGMTARRWHDTTYPDTNDFVQNITHFRNFAPGYAGVDVMSPAEKYDFLIGDYSYTLTNAQWAKGERHQTESGRVPGWAGLCHGWAPASIMAANPQQSVVVKAVDGTDVTFYPSDIKALASLAWGEASPRVRQVGSRCWVTDPSDDEMGRVRDYNCFDVNPGTWHMAIVNQMGAQHRSFVFDSTYDLQVWNFPIYKYRYSYFNPQTMTPTSNLGAALIPLADYSRDKFREFRSPNAKWVVGISMDLTYTKVTGPSTAPNNKVRSETIKYVYDLELDENLEVIGGEWYSNWHPDFIWSPPKDGRPMAKGESNLSWDGMFPVSPAVLQTALNGASAANQPIGMLVETLVKMANPNPNPAGTGIVPEAVPATPDAGTGTPQ